MSKPDWRCAHAEDLDAICAIAAQIHPDLPERPDVLAEKIRLCPGGCALAIPDNTTEPPKAPAMNSRRFIIAARHCPVRKSI